MRIYIKSPGKFAKYKGKVVLTHHQDNEHSIIRDETDDVHRVKTNTLDGLSIIELNEALDTNISLREVAEAEDFITIGEPKYDDVSYFKYISSHC
jgi:hypothetical protein